MLSRDWRLWKASTSGGVVRADRADVDRAAVGQRDIGLPPGRVGDLAPAWREPTGGRGSCEDEPGRAPRERRPTMTAVDDTPTTDESTTGPARCARRRCGLEITVKGATAGRAHPRRPRQPVQPGLHLPQGLERCKQLHEDPDRLRRPLDPPRRRPGHRHVGGGLAGTRPSPRSSGASRRSSSSTAATRWRSTSATRRPTRWPASSTTRPLLKASARRNLFSASTGRPDAQARVERAAVRQPAADSRCPTSTAPTTC